MNRYKLILMITVILTTGFMAASLLSYHVSRKSIHQAIIDTTLPLTSDNIYSEIQKDLVHPIVVSSMMASDTFLRDWLINDEADLEPISRYLQEIQDDHGFFVSFLVSEKTSNYYSAQGILRRINVHENRDAWYYRVRSLKQPYEINVDRDVMNGDALTIFVNYRVLDYEKKYLGAVGVGLDVASVLSLISQYQEKYRRHVYFVNEQGQIMLSGTSEHRDGSHIKQARGLGRIFPGIVNNNGGSYEYTHDEIHRLINVRFIPELKWYLFVEQETQEATTDIRQALYANILLSLLVTGLVVLLTHLALRHYQSELETMAVTDTLTGLPNRRAFDIVMPLFQNESSRMRSNIAFIILDLDHFKAVNDQYGHLGGDHVLAVTAKTIKGCMRAADFVCRWGGEEFLIVVKGSDEDGALLLAEKIRLAIESENIDYKNQNIHVTASLGVALISAEEEPERGIERADAALYEAKRGGRNRVNLGHAKEV
ncbi:sensor domain-containing diguanylate cyclase [Methylobacillus arboreus]|uniref:sensor domain-containing diguanylate cyclase n=1 Tax=Methylobacillus arboreus TaxID=755170 RepID=UPI001E5B43D5|nr:sensor domain-containing diguanylate cyclase [Methylobacillus arboreus]MCB5189354.1 sensor domain-containing diguanylate cyclase [Methylobacillus arboreus]